MKMLMDKHSYQGKNIDMPGAQPSFAHNNGTQQMSSVKNSYTKLYAIPGKQ